MDSIFETSWRRVGTVGLIGSWGTRAWFPSVTLADESVL